MFNSNAQTKIYTLYQNPNKIQQTVIIHGARKCITLYLLNLRLASIFDLMKLKYFDKMNN